MITRIRASLPPEASILTWTAVVLMASVQLLCAQDVNPSIEPRYDWNHGQELQKGIHFVRVEKTEPRRMVIHAARIDTSTPGLRLHTTPRRGEWVEGKTETDRQTTREFLRQSRSQGLNMVLAVNADAFSPWPAPYNQSTPTDLAGLAISDGVLVSRGSGSPSLMRSRSGKLQIARTTSDTDISDIEFAVSGFALCLNHGRPVMGEDVLHPRTGLGVSEDSRYLLIVVIDGRQPASLGATTGELGEWLLHFGAHRGINMDGGGSASLAWWDAASEDADKCRLLNRPVGNGIKAEQLPELLFVSTERANGNNLGVTLEVPEKVGDPANSSR